MEDLETDQNLNVCDLFILRFSDLFLSEGFQMHSGKYWQKSQPGGN